MTDQRITEAQECLSWLYDKIRLKKNSEIATIIRAAEQLGVDLSEVENVLQGSLHAYFKKVELMQRLLENEKQPTESNPINT